MHDKLHPSSKNPYKPARFWFDSVISSALNAGDHVYVPFFDAQKIDEIPAGKARDMGGQSLLISPEPGGCE